MTITTDDILGALQRGYDTVKGGGRTLAKGDTLMDDLDLDSLDAVDLLSVAEDDLGADTINAVVDAMADMHTVGDLVDALMVAVDRPDVEPDDAA